MKRNKFCDSQGFFFESFGYDQINYVFIYCFLISVAKKFLAPVDFAQHIFRRLGLYKPEVLDAWFGLFKTGRAEYYHALMQAMAQ